MGRHTVAVFSDLDRNAPYVSLADEAHHIGPTEARESYLNIDRIMDVAVGRDVDAVHPGYGFLSENPDFSAACEDAGITFIGPSEEAIRAVGNKVRARDLVEKAGASPVPGKVLSDQDEQEAGRVAEEIGFPILIKAAAGGGGKGMRVVEEPDAFGRAFREAQREAENAFGNPEVFLEKYVQQPRHVEIQVLADRRGNVVHFGERECSIQRRHQKLVEEAPSPIVDDELRREMGETATRIVSEAGYTGAGTVEFLVDAEKNFYFLEVNTRLQVEHPVTEMVYGFDLVREQIRVAEGAELDYTFDDLVSRGWAIECRICAEDPDADFMPSTGRIDNIVPPDGPFTRFDRGVRKGSPVTMHYDSLIGKLICWGRTRAQAVDRMKRALRETVIVGIQTTLPLYIEILNDPAFLEGDLSTRYLEGFEAGAEEIERAQNKAAEIAAVLAYRRERNIVQGASSPPSASGSNAGDRDASGWFEAGLREMMNRGR